jgi:serine/threonine protein kinase
MYSFPPGISIEDIKGYGTSGMAALIPNTKTIIKFPITAEAEERERCDREKSIYQLFQSSSYKRPTSLLQYKGHTNEGILLEFADLGPVRLYLRGLECPLPEFVFLCWAKEAAEALHFAHLNGVSHGDVNCTNFFITKDLGLKLGDFTSSFIHSSLPMDDLQQDIRNFGSAIYEMATGSLPFPCLSSTERDDKLLAKIYPDMRHTKVLQSIILGCWEGEYRDVEHIICDINKVGTSTSLLRVQCLIYSRSVFCNTKKSLEIVWFRSSCPCLPYDEVILIKESLH